MSPAATTYARLALSVLFKHGLGTLLALLLVWKLAGDWERKLEANSQKLDAVREAQAAQAAHAARMVLLLRAICLGVNATDNARAMCEVSQ